MTNSKGFIGVFDSGAGGISILRELVRHMPAEDFVYFGDSAHTPYGSRTPEDVARLSDAIVYDLVKDGAKAIVIACNTATSAAGDYLRTAYPNIPIIGVEPALKPAVEAARDGAILVMATEATLNLDKFHRLETAYASDSHVITVPCSGLAKAIESGDFDGDEMHDLIDSLVGSYRDKVSSVVLGCTHYPFVKNQIERVLGPVAFFDGAEGTARHTQRLLGQRNLLAPAGRTGTVTFRSSVDTPEQLALYDRFFNTPID